MWKQLGAVQGWRLLHHFRGSCLPNDPLLQRHVAWRLLPITASPSSKSCERPRRHPSLAFACYNFRSYTGCMVLQLKVRRIGNSIGLVLPKEAVAHLKVAEGDTVCVTEGTDGSLRVAPSDAEFVKQMEASRDIIRRYRNTLRELAK